MKKLSLIMLVLVFGLTLISAGCGDQPSKEAVSTAESAPIKIGTNRALGTVTPYVARAKGVFEKQGLKADIVDFQDGSTLMEAFATGQLDVAFVGIAPAATWQSKGIPLKVVASANGGGHVLLTRTDTGITDVKALKGKKIATPKAGTVTDTLFRSHILKEEAGLEADKDVQILSGMAPADMPAALCVSREVDAAITWEPFATQAESNFKDVKVLYDASAEWKKTNPDSSYYPVNVVVVRQAFIDQHPEVLKKFMSAYIEAVDFINNQQDEANEIIGKELQLDKNVIIKARERVDYTWKLDTKAELNTLAWANQLGYLNTIPEEKSLFDLTFLPQ